MASLRSLHPGLVPAAQWFVRALERAGINVTITSTRRDLDEQKQLYDCYRRTGCSNCRRGPGCFPAAAPGHGYHGIGVAFDLHLDPPRYRDAGALWERMGGTWGGHFGDPIHFDARRMVQR
jgi:hypothetical protein